MNVYLRNIIIVIIANIVVFLIGWGCIVPDVINDQTHLFGLIGDVEILKGNTSTVFGVCSIMSTLVMIVGMVEAIIEDFRRPCCPTRIEKPRKAPKFEAAKMRITDPASPEKVVDPSPKVEDEDKDPKTPTMD
jgi:hypothetical protein